MSQVRVLPGEPNFFIFRQRVRTIVAVLSLPSYRCRLIVAVLSLPSYRLSPATAKQVSLLSNVAR
jgi:hypothetical protein